MLTSRFTLCLVPFALLAACGETVGGSAGSPVSADSFDAYNQIGSDLAVAASGLGFTDPATLPPTGSAAYFGVLGVDIDPGTPQVVTAIGALDLTFQFSSDSVSGRVTDVIDDANQRYQGTLSITNGVLDRGADVTQTFTYFADMDGTLVSPDGDNLNVTAALAGDLLDTGIFAEGLVSGSVTGPDGTSPIEGGFIAERQ